MIFFRLSRWNSANFPSAVLVGVFGIVFNCRPHFRSHIHSQCGLFFIKNIGFCIFQQCESKKRIACVIYLCSIVGIIFFVFIILFFMWTVHMGGLLCSVGSVIPWIWHGNYSRISVCCLWIPRIFISFGCYFTGSIYLSDCHFNRFQRKHAVFQKDTSWQEDGRAGSAAEKQCAAFFYSFFYFNWNINHRRFGRCTDHSLLFRLICILIER